MIGSGIFEGFKDSSTYQTYTPPYYQRSGAIAGVYVMPCGVGTFTLSGQAVELKESRLLPVGAGALTLSGQAVELKEGHRMPAGAGAFALSGQAADLKKTNLLPMGAGTFSLGGQAVALKAGKLCAIGAGTFVLTGQDATLTYVPVSGDKVMPVGAGSFALSGQVVALKEGYLATIGAGTFALTGQAVNFRYFHMSCGAGVYSVSGEDVALVKPQARGGLRRRPAREPWRAPVGITHYRLGCEAGRFLLRGRWVELEIGKTRDHRAILEAGNFIVDGQSIKSRRGLDLRVLNEQAILDLILADAA